MKLDALDKELFSLDLGRWQFLSCFLAHYGIKKVIVLNQWRFQWLLQWWQKKLPINPAKKIAPKKTGDQMWIGADFLIPNTSLKDDLIATGARVKMKKEMLNKTEARNDRI